MMRAAVIAFLIVTTGCGKGDKPSAAGQPAAPAPPPPAPASPPPAPVVDAAPPAPPATRAERLEVEHIASTVAVDALVPVGWIRRGKLATWDPPDAMQLPMWHRSFEISSTCDGECTPAVLDKKVPALLDAVIARHRQPRMSGDPAQDDKAIAPVTVLERGDLPQGGAFVLLRVGKPPGFEGHPYPDIFDGTCITRRRTDEFMIVTRIRAAPDDEHAWWPELVKACKATAVAAP